MTAKNCTKAIWRLNPVLKNGLLRVGGRLSGAPVVYETKHPTILPRDSHLTNLIVMHCHETVGHGGVNHTFGAIRERYWLHNGSSVIRKVLKDCFICRRTNTATEAQQMADLPNARLQMLQPVFFHTGCNCFGPFLVKQGRSLVKWWGCIFTCMTVRALHLEVLHSLSTDSFMSALRRFINRRGNIGHMYSNNGSNFVRADRAVKEGIKKWNQSQITEFLFQKEIEWSYNTPLASNFGGCWERLIRSVRKALASFMPKATFSDEDLLTLFVEIEGMINSRPLTPVSFVENLERTLTPNDLLLLSPASGLPPAKTGTSDMIFTNRWRQVQTYVDLFWKRWAKEYLPTIRVRSKWHDLKRNVAENDVVVVVDESTPRSQWPMAKVVKTFPDKKGLVRSVVVKNKFGEFKRPKNKISVIVPVDFQASAPSWLSSL